VSWRRGGRSRRRSSFGTRCDGPRARSWARGRGLARRASAGRAQIDPDEFSRRPGGRRRAARRRSGREEEGAKEGRVHAERDQERGAAEAERRTESDFHRWSGSSRIVGSAEKAIPDWE
jgi:hypothetical protein